MSVRLQIRTVAELLEQELNELEVRNYKSIAKKEDKELEAYIKKIKNNKSSNINNLSNKYGFYDQGMDYINFGS